jgi:hypothetical protein
VAHTKVKTTVEEVRGEKRGGGYKKVKGRKNEREKRVRVREIGGGGGWIYGWVI